MEQLFGAPVLEAYGMTEARIRWPRSAAAAGRKPGSVGPEPGSIGMDDAGNLSLPANAEVVIQPQRGFGTRQSEANAKSFTNGGSALAIRISIPSAT